MKSAVAAQGNFGIQSAGAFAPNRRVVIRLSVENRINASQMTLKPMS
jgi:hypothetical protein